jgi:hypothetical protein
MGARASPLARIVVILVLGWSLIAGCGSDRSGNGLRFTNKSDVSVMITAIEADGTERAEPIVHELGPGLSIAVNDRFLVNACRDVILIARSDDGVEVARRAGQMCAPGEWTIEHDARRSP